MSEEDRMQVEALMEAINALAEAQKETNVLLREIHQLIERRTRD